jgi:hypothetical protein
MRGLTYLLSMGSSWMAHFIVHDPILGLVVEMYHAPSLAWKVNPFSTSTGRDPEFNLLPDLEKHDISQLLVFR